jgi:integrase/recombinase XerD
MYKFQSIYAKHLIDFVEMKKSLGFKCKTLLVHLRHIDLYAKNEISSGITREFAERWGTKRTNESDNYRYSRVGILIQFCTYLSNIGIPSYIPKLPPFPKSTFIPYIYTPEEIEKIFSAVDNLRLCDAMMQSAIFSVPTIIRLLYATGIRISEVLSLKDEHVNMDEQYLLITDCKNKKERLIPISTSLTSVCKQYIEQRNRLPILRESGYFFVKLDGKKCTQLAVTNWFKKCLREASIKKQDRGLPRVHDLRHTFAVTSLANMADTGVDLYASLPILSNYLGHQSIGATNHYVRLTAHMYPSLINDINITSLNVFPKFNQYEAD